MSVRSEQRGSKKYKTPRIENGLINPHLRSKEAKIISDVKSITSDSQLVMSDHTPIMSDITLIMTDDTRIISDGLLVMHRGTA